MTQEYLKSILKYNETTGTFTWIVAMGVRGVVGGTAGSTRKDTKYVNIQIDQKAYKAHRLAWLYMYGMFPKNEIDHINHDRSDNRISNLRDVTIKDNMKNLPLYSINSSGKMGVNRRKGTSSWVAYININKKRIHIGSYTTKEEAIKAREEAETLHNFHKNHGR